ncbi:lipoprotein [Salmonella enterica subsp. enterica]|uniref:Lipoprotein n=1 Tax=Salmonella enterica I TaxID=59201 RepID=A0A379WMG4_SALET|nr:lipoprotein [Salmonella enterica subsp. enterica]
MSAVLFTNGQRAPVARLMYCFPKFSLLTNSVVAWTPSFAPTPRRTPKTGLGNRLFFDNQLATLLEDQEKVGVHGVVMMIRLPDFNLLRDSLGGNQAEEQMFMLINLLSTFIMRYPGSLLARYHRSDFAVLLPHRTLKEAESIAGQLLKAVDALPANKMLDRDDMVHIGICAWRSGQSTEQVMEHAEAAARNAALQGGK